MNCRSLAQDTSQIIEKKVSRLPPSYWMHIGSIQLVQPMSPIKLFGISSWWFSNILCISDGKKIDLCFAPLSVGSVRSLSAPNAPN